MAYYLAKKFGIKVVLIKSWLLLFYLVVIVECMLDQKVLARILTLCPWTRQFPSSALQNLLLAFVAIAEYHKQSHFKWTEMHWLIDLEAMKFKICGLALAEGILAVLSYGRRYRVVRGQEQQWEGTRSNCHHQKGYLINLLTAILWLYV